MASSGDGGKEGGIEESNGSQTGLVGDENPQNRPYNNFSGLPKRLKFLKFGSLASPSAKFQRITNQKDQISRTVPSSSSHAFRERFVRMFSRKLDWASLWSISKEWIRDPKNMAFFVWIVAVGVSDAILLLVMTGMLNNVQPRKSQRDAWLEVNNQILNALFTLMSLYKHPKLIYHVVLLFRWRPVDITKLRKIYCKGGTYKPREWAYMMVVVTLLNINCFAQYALCGLNLGYKRSERPAIGVAICIAFSSGASPVGVVYSIVSPLGKDYHLDEEAIDQIAPTDACQPSQLRLKSLEKKFSFASRDDRRIVESRPEWSGGVFDFWDDPSLAYLSLLCGFCVFGWNMKGLGFGNMYVHIAIFLLFCMAPFWIIYLAAININNEAVRGALGVTGVFLCLFGLLYGGFWRTQMRKRFNLPAYNFCCDNPAAADCALWLFCCWCSLAQEVRTGNSYDIIEDKFIGKQVDDCGQSPISPLPHEDGDFQLRSGPSSPFGNIAAASHVTKTNSPSPGRFSREYHTPDRHLPLVEEGKDETMTPPTPPLIQKEAN